MKKKIIKYLLFTILLSIPKIVLATEKVSCGNVNDIPKKIPELTSFFITLAQVAATVILVILGSIDLFKGLTSSKEDEIKKGQQIFIKRIIVAALIFFIVVIVKLLVGIVADSSTSNIVDCIDCFISKNCNLNINTNNNSSNTTNKNNNSKKKEEAKKVTTKNTSTKNTTTKNSSSNKNSTAKSKTSKKNNTLYVGDSRTVQMCEIYKFCGNDYIAKGSMAYDWFVNTGIPYVNNKIKSKEYNIVILMGVNGLYNNNGKANAEKYFNKVSSLATKEWKKQNIIFVSVNPVYDSRTYYTKMRDVNGFNNTMKNKISSSKLSNLSYCDTATRLNLSASNYDREGLHYDKSTYQKIYNIIKNSCLK